MKNNVMRGAARAGLSIMAPDAIADFPADENIITRNIITGSIDAGVHIQGDRNTVKRNRIFKNGGYGIYLCGMKDDGCYPPGANAESEGNRIVGNSIRKNAKGSVGDFGTGNRVRL